MICLIRLGLGHAGHAALGANHGRHALQRHHRGGAGLFGDAGLLHVHHVHDDAALEHLGQADLQAQAGSGKILVSIHVQAYFFDLDSATAATSEARRTARIQFSISVAAM